MKARGLLKKAKTTKQVCNWTASAEVPPCETGEFASTTFLPPARSHSVRNVPGTQPSQALFRQRQGVFWQQRGFAGGPTDDYDIIQMEAGLSRIDGYDDYGFLVNNAYLEGPIMCSGMLTTLWNVETLANVTPESLSLLLLFRPAPDILVVGCGPHLQQLPPALHRWLEANGMAVECQDTANALSTFNILNQEGRKVAAALLPISQKDISVE